MLHILERRGEILHRMIWHLAMPVYSPAMVCRGGILCTTPTLFTSDGEATLAKSDFLNKRTPSIWNRYHDKEYSGWKRNQSQKNRVDKDGGEWWAYSSFEKVENIATWIVIRCLCHLLQLRRESLWINLVKQYLVKNRIVTGIYFISAVNVARTQESFDSSGHKFDLMSGGMGSQNLHT